MAKETLPQRIARLEKEAAYHNDLANTIELSAIISAAIAWFFISILLLVPYC
jgi:hypothetical protein